MSEINKQDTQVLQPIAPDDNAIPTSESIDANEQQNGTQQDQTLSTPPPKKSYSTKYVIAAATIGVLAALAFAALLSITAIDGVAKTANTAFEQINTTNTQAQQTPTNQGSQDSAGSAQGSESSAQNGTQQESNNASESSNATSATTNEHQHTWETNWVLEVTPETTHTEQHAATYKQVTEYHTLCNDCKEEIDGAAQAHLEATGHSGYTTDVPVVKQVVDTPAWTETVVDTPEREELVANGQICSECGEVRDAS